MVLEATVLCLDNSDYMRNGDYTPTRLEAQNDAVTFLFNAKTQSNPENTVALLTTAGNSPQVLVTLTSDIGKILTAIHKIPLKSPTHFSTSLNIAQLALKHRENKTQKQRIIVFVASPIQESVEVLIKLGKKLKKNNVAVDVISFGEEGVNEEKLDGFIKGVNNSDNSHLIQIPPGPHLLTDILSTSPLLTNEDGTQFQAHEFGVDPNLDPELALALRISLEEEKARQGKSVEDTMIESALDQDVDMGGTEEEEMQMAIAMSMGDDEMMGEILGGLPGVDASDPRISGKKDGKSPKK
jgi:26S proteasome regulatory subunit N10